MDIDKDTIISNYTKNLYHIFVQIQEYKGKEVEEDDQNS